MLGFDTGERVVLEGLVLVGRRPEGRPGEVVRHLVALPSADMSLSKTHAQVGVAPDGALVVMDRGSTNGSVLVRQGVSRPLSGGRPTTLLEGDVVRFGDRSMRVSREGLTRTRFATHGVLRRWRDRRAPCSRRPSGTTSTARWRRIPTARPSSSSPPGAAGPIAALNHDVDLFARGLIAGGIAKGDRVGVWAPNCAEWTIAQYATAKIGAILVNVNPAYRTHEFTYAVNHSGLRMLISAESFKTSDYRAMVDGDRRRHAPAWSASSTSAPATGPTWSPPGSGSTPTS